MRNFDIFSVAECFTKGGCCYYLCLL